LFSNLVPKEVDMRKMVLIATALTLLVASGTAEALVCREAAMSPHAEFRNSPVDSPHFESRAEYIRLASYCPKGYVPLGPDVAFGIVENDALRKPEQGDFRRKGNLFELDAPGAVAFVYTPQSDASLDSVVRILTGFSKAGSLERFLEDFRALNSDVEGMVVAGERYLAPYYGKLLFPSGVEVGEQIGMLWKVTAVAEKKEAIVREAASSPTQVKEIPALEEDVRLLEKEGTFLAKWLKEALDREDALQAELVVQKKEADFLAQANKGLADEVDRLENKLTEALGRGDTLQADNEQFLEQIILLNNALLEERRGNEIMAIWITLVTLFALAGWAMVFWRGWKRNKEWDEREGHIVEYVAFYEKEKRELVSKLKNLEKFTYLYEVKEPLVQKDGVKYIPLTILERDENTEKPTRLGYGNGKKEVAFSKLNSLEQNEEFLQFYGITKPAHPARWVV